MANLGRTPPQHLAYTPRKVMQAAVMCLALRGPYISVVKKGNRCDDENCIPYVESLKLPNERKAPGNEAKKRTQTPSYMKKSAEMAQPML
jgi:hypothetical protein